MEALIRQILREHGDLSIPVEKLAPDANLFDAGLSSFGSAEVMVALEEHFGCPLPAELLSRTTFETIAAMCDAAAQMSRMSTTA